MFRVEPDRGMQKNYTGWSDNSEIAHIDQKVFEELGIFFTQLVLKRLHV